MNKRDLKIISFCPECQTMLREYEKALLTQPNWFKKVRRAHLYGNHKLK